LTGFVVTKKEISTFLSTKHVITDKGNASSRKGDINLSHDIKEGRHSLVQRFITLVQQCLELQVTEKGHLRHDLPIIIDAEVYLQ